MAISQISPFTHYNAYVEKVDSFCRDIAAAYSVSISCHSGCDGCCQHLSLFPVEAFHLRMFMETCDGDVQQKIRDKATLLLDHSHGACPLLGDGICLMYEARPMICRTHGYPVLPDNVGEKKVDHCPLNFTAGEKIERRHILDLKTLNTTLAVINSLFVSECLDIEGLPDRILLAQALLMDIDSI